MDCGGLTHLRPLHLISKFHVQRANVIAQLENILSSHSITISRVFLITEIKIPANADFSYRRCDLARAREGW